MGAQERDMEGTKKKSRKKHKKRGKNDSPDTGQSSSHTGCSDSDSDSGPPGLVFGGNSEKTGMAGLVSNRQMTGLRVARALAGGGG